MKKTTHILIIATALFTSSAFCQNAEQSVAVDALGAKKWNAKNNHGVKCLNYDMGNHRLRLEDVIVHKETKEGKTTFWGTLTITNRRWLKPDPHIFVTFKIVAGKTEHLQVSADGGGNWLDALPDDWVSKGAKKILDAVMSLGTSGDAQKPMATSLWSVMEGYRVASQK